MPPKGWRKPVLGDADDPEGLIAWTRRYLDDMRVKAYSDRTIITTRVCLNLFIDWAFHRGLTHRHELTRQVVEHYQRALFEQRRPDGRPLTLSSQRVRLQKLRGLCKWMAKTEALPFNPASEVELPRLERRLPRAVLNEKEAEQVLSVPDLDKPTGVRDRAMMEVLYSTGIRRAELTSLRRCDINGERGTLTVRLGKGKKDRVVPIGERALAWLDRYLEDVRPDLVVSPDGDVVFLTAAGRPLDPARLTHLMSRYVRRAELGKPGACHIFRHTMATLMLERGADIRVIQEILGHEELSTTEIYTRVSIAHLKAVHDRTHPGAKLEPPVPATRESDTP
jgi:integrase/recombinase XerD